MEPGKGGNGKGKGKVNPAFPERVPGEPLEVPWLWRRLVKVRPANAVAVMAGGVAVLLGGSIVMGSANTREPHPAHRRRPPHRCDQALERVMEGVSVGEKPGEALAAYWRCMAAAGEEPEPGTEGAGLQRPN